MGLPQLNKALAAILWPEPLRQALADPHRLRCENGLRFAAWAKHPRGAAVGGHSVEWNLADVYTRKQRTANLFPRG